MLQPQGGIAGHLNQKINFKKNFFKRRVDVQLLLRQIF